MARWQTLLVVLALLVALFSASVAAQTEDEQKDNERMRELSTMKNVGPLAGWVGIGRGILNAALNGYPTAAYSNGGFDFKALIMWLVPAIVLLAICLLFAVITLCCVCPCFYCCRSCGACGGSEPKPGGYTRQETITAMVVMAIGICLVMIGFLIGLVSNSVLDKGVSNMEFAVTEVISDVLALPDQFQDTFGTIVTSVDNTVEEVLDLVRQVPTSLLGSDGQLTLLVHNTTDYLREIQAVFDTLIANGNSISATVNNIVQNYEILKPEVDAVNARVALFDNPQLDDPDTYYSLDFSCISLGEYRPVVAVNVTGLFPDFMTLLSDIDGINLNDTANMVDQSFDQISFNVTTMIDEQFANVKSQVDSFVDQAQGFIDNSLNGTFSSVLDQISNIQDTIQEGVDQYVVPNNRWRYIIMACLFAFNGLAAVICLLGFFLKNSPLMTCSSVLSFFLVFLFWILCALHLIIAAPSGKLCNAFYKRDILDAIPPNLLGGLGGSRRRAFDFGNISNPIFEPQEPAFYLNLFYDGLDHCHEGGNLIEFLNLTDLVDLSSYVDEFVDSVDFDSLVNQVNISSFVGNVDFTSGLNLTQVTSYLAYLNDDYTVYVNILEGIAFKPVVRAINNNTALLSSFKDDTALIESCFTPETNVTDPSAVAARISLELNSIYTELQRINSTTIQFIDGNVTSLRTQLTDFANFANSTVDLTTEVITFIDGIAAKLIQIGDNFVFTVTNQTIPSGIQLVRNLADDIEGSIIGFTNCTWVADDLLGTINSLCISTVGGLDAVWVTCGFLGLVLFIMIAGATLTAKRKIRSDALDQEHPMDDDFYDNRNNMELPPIYSESSEKA